MPEHLTADQIRTSLASAQGINGNAFLLLRSIAAILNAEASSSTGHELVLRALDRRSQFGDAVILLDALTETLGLYPYLNPADLDTSDRIAYEFHRPLNMELANIVFHRVQAEVYRELYQGNSVILSAPTSFGKSLIIDAMIATGRYSNFAVVVPTIALVDETRRRLSRFRQTYKVITHPSQARAKKNIFVVTQERLLEMEDSAKVDFFVIDEFYKLHMEADPERSLLLNHAFYKLLRNGKQFYLLGPNITGIPSTFPERFKCTFFRTDFATVVSEVHRVTAKDDDAGLLDLCRTLQEPTLIYCSSPARVRYVAKLLVENKIGTGVAAAAEMADWVAAEYDPAWIFGTALRQGIGLHHGRVPRSLSQLVVRLFNDELLPFLICTSTLIEGVNTKAKNVIILDNKVAKKKFDYFTFNNIRGRSGRMFEHFIGRVYIFHDPPHAELPFVDFPWFTQNAKTPEGLLIQLEKGDLTPQSEARLRPFLTQGILDVDVLRRNVGVDPAAQLRLAQTILAKPQAYSRELNWSGMPTYDQLKVVCTLIWDFLVVQKSMRAGVASGSQLTFKINQLRSIQNVRALIQNEMSRTTDPDEAVENVLEFLRYWATFHFPRHLMALDAIQRSIFTKQKLPAGDYSVFASQVENLFIDPAIIGLDEYGVPLQIGQRIQSYLNPHGDLDVALSRLRALNVDGVPLTPFENRVLKIAQADL